MNLADEIEKAMDDFDLFGTQRIDTLLYALKSEEENEDEFDDEE